MKATQERYSRTIKVTWVAPQYERCPLKYRIEIKGKTVPSSIT